MFLLEKSTRIEVTFVFGCKVEKRTIHKSRQLLLLYLKPAFMSIISGGIKFIYGL